MGRDLRISDSPESANPFHGCFWVRAARPQMGGRHVPNGSTAAQMLDRRTRVPNRRRFDNPPAFRQRKSAALPSTPAARKLTRIWITTGRPMNQITPPSERRSVRGCTM